MPIFEGSVKCTRIGGGGLGFVVLGAVRVVGRRHMHGYVIDTIKLWAS